MFYPTFYYFCEIEDLTSLNQENRLLLDIVKQRNLKHCCLTSNLITYILVVRT